MSASPEMESLGRKYGFQIVVTTSDCTQVTTDKIVFEGHGT